MANERQWMNDIVLLTIVSRGKDTAIIQPN